MVAAGAVLCLPRTCRLHFLQGNKRLSVPQGARLGEQGLLQEQKQNCRHHIQG